MPKVKYEIESDPRGFKAGFAQARQEARAFADDLKARLGGAGSVLGAFGPKGALAAAGIGAVTVAVGALASEALRLGGVADELNNIATASGLSKRFLQEAGFAARSAGGDLGTVTNAVRTMQQGIAQGDPVIKKLVGNLAELRKQSPDQQFVTLAQKIREIQDPADQVFARIAVFGKDPALAPMIGSFEELRAKANELGVVLEDDVLDAASQLRSKADQLGEAWTGVKNQFAATLVESGGLDQAIEGMTDALGGLSAWIQANKGDLNEIVGLFGDMAAVLGPIAKMGLGKMLQEAKAVAAVGSGVAGAINAVTSLPGMVADRLGAAARLGPFGQGRGRAFGGPGSAGVGPPPAGSGDAGGIFDPEKIKAAEEARKKAAKDRLEFEKMEFDLRGRLIELGEKELDQLAKLEKEQLESHAENIEALQKELQLMDEALLKQGLGAGLPKQRNIFDVFPGAAPVMGGTKAGDVFLEGPKKQTEEVVKKTIEWRDMLQDVAHQFQTMGGPGGLIGSIVGGIAGAAAQVQRLRTSVKDGGLAGAGGFGGFLGKAAAGLGIVGAAVGIGSAIAGFFGRRREEEKKREEERQAAQKKAIEQLEGLQERLSRFRTAQLEGAVGGVSALFKNLAVGADVTQERLDRVGRLGAAAFQALKAEGLSTVEALQKLGPSLDAALEAARAAGLELPAALAEFAAFRELALENKELMAAAEGVGALVNGLRATGNLTQATLADVQAEVGDLMKQFEAAGFSGSQSLAAVAPALFAIREAARDGRHEVDAATQALIDQAETAGLFENMKNPMQELVEIQKMQLAITAELAKVFGAVLPAEVQKYIDALNRVPTVAGPPGMPDVTTMPNKFPEDADAVSAAVGFGPARLRRDTVFLAHRNEHVLIVPAGKQVGFKSAASGFGARGEGGGPVAAAMERLLSDRLATPHGGSEGQGAEATVIHNVVKIGERVLVDALSELIRDNRHGAGTRIRG